jgi:hypothetical protein
LLETPSLAEAGDDANDLPLKELVELDTGTGGCGSCRAEEPVALQTAVSPGLSPLPRQPPWADVEDSLEECSSNSALSSATGAPGDSSEHRSEGWPPLLAVLLDSLEGPAPYPARVQKFLSRAHHVLMQFREGRSLCDVEECSLRDCKVWYDWSKQQVTRLLQDWVYFVVLGCRFSEAVLVFLAVILHGRQEADKFIRPISDDARSFVHPFPWLGSRPYGKWR